MRIKLKLSQTEFFVQGEYYPGNRSGFDQKQKKSHDIAFFQILEVGPFCCVLKLVMVIDNTIIMVCENNPLLCLLEADFQIVEWFLRLFANVYPSRP